MSLSNLSNIKAIHFVQFKMRTSNREEVSLQKYEIIRYKCQSKPRPHKHVVDDSRPNTVSHAVRVRIS